VQGPVGEMRIEKKMRRVRGRDPPPKYYRQQSSKSQSKFKTMPASALGNRPARGKKRDSQKKGRKKKRKMLIGEVSGLWGGGGR